MKKLLLATIAFVALGAGSSAPAADIPLKAPPRAVAGQYGGWYIWVDGSYQDIRLPSVALGLKRSDLTTFLDLGPRHQQDPEATGVGVRGAVGYLLPHGTLPAFFGGNARFELGGSFVDADDSQTQSIVIPATPGSTQSTITQLLNGATTNFAFQCSSLTCAHTSVLGTDYRSWQLEGKLAGDHKTGPMTLTPWLSVFGGQTRADHTLAQNLLTTSGATMTYNASTSLRWTDFGAKLGLEGKIEVTNWLAFGLGGWIGVAARDASLTGTDTCTDSFGIVCGATGVLSSSISTNARATPFLANAEASVIYRLASNVAARGFVGLNYDSRVPGISSPSFTGTFFAPTSVTPAGIKFEGETSWYAGGGVVWKFGGPVVASY